MIKHIFIPLDTSRLAECVLPHAVALARTFEAKLTLLHVIEPAHTSNFIDPLAWDFKKVEARAYLEGVAARLSESSEPVQYMLLEGKPEECIIRTAQSNDQSLLLLSSHAQGGSSEWKLGSVVQKVMSRRHVSTMIVRADAASDLQSEGYHRILAPLDGSQRAECVLPLVADLTRFYKAQVILAHSIPRPEMPRGALTPSEDLELAHQITERRRLDALQYLEQTRAQVGLDAEIRLLVSDNTAEALHQLIAEEKIDLVVMSAHGYSGKTEWSYGSLAVNFITYGTTPLLIVQDCPDTALSDEEEATPRGVQELLLQRR